MVRNPNPFLPAWNLFFDRKSMVRVYNEDLIYPELTATKQKKGGLNVSFIWTYV